MPDKWVVVAQSVFMQLRRVVGVFDSVEAAEQWARMTWNEYDVCTVMPVEKVIE